MSHLCQVYSDRVTWRWSCSSWMNGWQLFKLKQSLHHPKFKNKQVIIPPSPHSSLALTACRYRSTASSARCRLSVLRLLALCILSFAARRPLVVRASSTRAPRPQTAVVSRAAVRLSSFNHWRNLSAVSMVSPSRSRSRIKFSWVTPTNTQTRRSECSRSCRRARLTCHHHPRSSVFVINDQLHNCCFARYKISARECSRTPIISCQHPKRDRLVHCNLYFSSYL